MELLETQKYQQKNIFIYRHHLASATCKNIAKTPATLIQMELLETQKYQL
jgi:hypothetical protein